MSDRQEQFVDLPHLARVFSALRRGRHICLADGQIYSDLNSHAEDFRLMFCQLGFDLVRHPRDFFYFIDQNNFSDSAARMALFMFILIEYLADHGEPVEETIMSRRFNYADLPHFSGERYKNMMSESGISTISELENLVRTMERFGFVERFPDNTFSFRTPSYRFLDICMEMNAEQQENASPGDEADLAGKDEQP